MFQCPDDDKQKLQNIFFIPFQALPTITQYIKSGDYAQLIGLFSQRAKDSLIKDVETNWTELQKNNINIEFDDMNSTVIDKCFYHKVGRDVFVDITVKYCAIKKDLHPAMSIELTATFSRKYGPGCLPDWTITDFKIDHVAPI